MTPRLKIVGQLDPDLQILLEQAGYDIEVLHPLEVDADNIESPDPVILSDVGRYTARAIGRGLQRDVQATQRLFLWELEGTDDTAASQELQALIDFTQAVTRTHATTEVADAAVRFLQREVGVVGVAIHYWSDESGLTLSRAAGYEASQLAALEEYLKGVVDPLNVPFRQGLRFGEGPDDLHAPINLDVVVPILAKDSLMGALSVCFSAHIRLSVDVLKAMGRHLALSLLNSDLLQRSEEALGSLRVAQQSMSQSEKLAAVGMLAAGIAHEINNPASFIITNLTMLTEYIDDILVYTDELSELHKRTSGADQGKLDALQEVHDLEYLRQDTPDLIARCLKGMHRIRDIVRELRSFAHKGSGQGEWVDINQLIAQVLKLAGAELRHRASVELDLRPVPNVVVESTRLLQVLLNLLINAYQAFGDRPRSENSVRVASSADEETVMISVSDNGSGITQEVQDRIFEPFFTTKPVGTGTGLGLAISYDLMKTMGGEIILDSTPGRGSQFLIRIPLRTEEHGDGVEWREATQSS